MSTTRLITVVYGKQGLAACKIFSLQQFLLLCQLNFMDKKDSYRFEVILGPSVFVDITTFHTVVSVSLSHLQCVGGYYHILYSGVCHLQCVGVITTFCTEVSISATFCVCWDITTFYTEVSLSVTFCVCWDITTFYTEVSLSLCHLRCVGDITTFNTVMSISLHLQYVGDVTIFNAAVSLSATLCVWGILPHLIQWCVSLCHQRHILLSHSHCAMGVMCLLASVFFVVERCTSACYRNA